MEMMKRALAELEANPGGDMDEDMPEEGEHPEGVVIDIGVRPTSKNEEDLLSAFDDENPEDDPMAMFRRRHKKGNPERMGY